MADTNPNWPVPIGTLVVEGGPPAPPPEAGPPPSTELREAPGADGGRRGPPSRLTEHFDVVEWEQPARRGLPAASYPPEWVEERLRPLAEILEVLRAELGGRPIRVISGYRGPAYNAAIGGAEKSQHMEGRAADIMVEGVAPAAVHDVALRLHQEGRIRLGGLGEYPKFTHMDVRPGPLARWHG